MARGTDSNLIMGKKDRYNTKRLSSHLRELAAEAETILDDGTCLTKGEVLARLLWSKAIGSKETKLTDEGKEEVIVHPPERWAAELVFDRLEGRVPQAITEDESRVKVAERVSDLNKNRLNSMTKRAVAAGPSSPPPPTFKRPEDK